MGTTTTVIIPRKRDNKKIYEMLVKLKDFKLVSLNFKDCFLMPEVFGTNVLGTNGILLTVRKKLKNEFVEINPYSNLGLPVRFVRKTKSFPKKEKFENAIEIEPQIFQLNLNEGVDIIMGKFNININYDPSIYKDIIFIRMK